MRENKKILNLTRHPALDSQIKAGVVEPDPETKDQVREILTFDEPPSVAIMESRARALGLIAKHHGYTTVMIGGAPFFMSTLERVLTEEFQIAWKHGFSMRISTEEIQSDGTVKKTQVYQHVGWVPAEQ